jgi:hypothetical protein
MSGSIRKTAVFRRGGSFVSDRLFVPPGLFVSRRLFVSCGLTSGRLLNASRSRTMGRDVPAADTAHAAAPLLAASLLGENGSGKDCQHSKENDNFLQTRPPFAF